MKRIFCICVCLALLLCACSLQPGGRENKKYTATFLTLFDTVTTVVGYAESEAAFEESAQGVYERLSEYHKLFDIYNEYEDTVSLKYVNDHAGAAPVTVSREIILLLQDLKEIYRITGGQVNAAMGSVLSLWHEARTYSLSHPDQPRVPAPDALQSAYLHTDFDKVIIDEAASTVYFADPLIRLDVGAVAKGWATEKVALASPAGLLISVGGNVRATGPRDDEGSAWIIGIQDPDNANAHLHTVYLTTGSLVTSGDYQRAYSVNGALYHHIIDPDTLYPAALWRSVTVLCPDSGIADALSTALFVMSYEDGQRLLSQFGAEAVWMDLAGNLVYSPGFKAHIRT